MYEVSVKDHFSAAHSLKEIGGGCERIHGHNFKVEVFLKSEELLPDSTVMDFRKLKSHLKDVIDILDHTILNEVPPFDVINPSSENIARFIYDEMRKRLDELSISGGLRVDVWESDNSRASYYEE
ncbi:MAG: 6-carboxytetrahydropterin synthase QueD [Deltaproteobacteria bacterium]|uniref:6-carboxy-5,6,7,8-tetrahydropterin synthase n=1 Tax=Candidatus Zymogenus saltonus TaxID=2844893 RepID=A0A9D8PR06_9DELT|nr:6-carboxytetrahydropterin synthase QueD [Candidatus Zymogenus saltonus]